MWRWHGPSARQVGREEARPEGRCLRLRGRRLARRARSCCRSELSPLLHRALPSWPRLLAAFSPARYCPPGDPGLRWVETVMSDMTEPSPRLPFACDETHHPWAHEGASPAQRPSARGGPRAAEPGAWGSSPLRRMPTGRPWAADFPASSPLQRAQPWGFSSAAVLRVT